ncbi:MAG: hypothetical protein IJT49_02505 [Clostridia bacterium]|nr:hypothetical protein [Clostridia bacterium]
MDRLFFSETLKNKLEKIKTCALSALEAPAGYGKTTAIRRLFSEGDASVRWFTAVEGMADNSFRWFIRQLGAVDETAARELQDLGYLNRSNATQAARILSDLHPTEPLTLIFDNFQFALQSWQPQVLDALAKCGEGGLRTVFISQNFGRLRDVLIALEGSVCYIRSRDLLLSENDVDAYARQLGIDADAEEIRKIYLRTNGWTAAVSLYLENLKEGLLEGGSEGLDDLISVTFWQKLTDTQRETILRLCLFDQISSEALDALVPVSVLPKEELTPLLRRRLAETDADFQSEVLVASAKLYRKNGMIKEAVGCYYRAGDYEAILSLELVCLITENFDGAPYTTVVRTVLEKCTDDVLRRYRTTR